MPSVSAIGSQCVVGIAFMLAHARACLPPVNCSAWMGWQSAHTSTVAISTRATSSAVLCPSP